MQPRLVGADESFSMHPLLTANAKYLSLIGPCELHN
jgi:hypothetical protein